MWIRKVLVTQGHGCRQIYPKSMIHVHQNKVTGPCTLSSFLVWKPLSVDYYWSSVAVIRRGIRSMSSQSVSPSSSTTAVQDSAGSSPIIVGGDDATKDQDVRRRADKSAVLREIYGVSNTTIRDSGRGMGTTATTAAVASATTDTTTTTTQYPPPSSSSSSSSPSPTRRLRMNLNHHENNSSGHHPTATTGINALHLDSTLYRNNTINTRNKMAAAHLMQQQRQRQRQQQQQQQGRLPSSPTLSSTSSSSNLGFTRRQQLPHQRGGVAAGGRGRESDTNTIAARVHVTSIYVARHLDVVAILSNVFGKMNVTQHRFGRTSVTVQFPPRSDDTNSSLGKERQQPKDLEPSTTTTTTSTIYNNNNNYKNVEDTLLPRYVVVFRFGSCVFFNFTNREVRLLLEEIKKRSDCCIDPLPNGFEQREQFDIAISPGLEETSPFVSGDVATIKMLDLNNVAVISTVMGQTVALDSYNIYADELLATFATINTNVKRTGNFTSMERNALFKVIAQNNSLFIDMVSKLGLKDRSDTVAWNYTQYDAVYQGMRDEFLIDERFDDIEFKLNLIQQNTKFFLEVMHQNKTNLLEWIIIGLIALECGLMCLEMSGMGHLLFETLGITTAATTGTTAISDTTSAATLAKSTSIALLDSK